MLSATISYPAAPIDGGRATSVTCNAFRRCYRVFPAISHNSLSVSQISRNLKAAPQYALATTSRPARLMVAEEFRLSIGSGERWIFFLH